MTMQHRAAAGPRHASDEVPPARLRLAFYGDDFTGSTDALEVLAFAGLRSALFLEPPSREALAQAGPLDAFGVAGDSRAMTPAEMDACLPTVFAALADSGAPIVHYKVCSTFDSAPGIGSIGRAMEISRRCFGHAAVPIVGGTPSLRRFCAFGHLFARSATDDQVHRIDRHPIMSAHPVTPMDESDLRLHLGRQASSLKLANLPFPQLDAGHEAAESYLQSLLAQGADGVVIDSLTPAQLTEVGHLLARHAANAAPLFVVGPSGVEYALTQWWREARELGGPATDYAQFRPATRVLAISASASRLSAQQIDAAVEAGYVDLPIDAAALLNERRWQATLDELVTTARHHLARGDSVILHTARGPQDPRIDASLAALQAQGMTREQARQEGGRLLGQRLGLVAQAVLRTEQVERLLLSGGDTSSQIVKTLAPQALLVAARLTPGAPLCRLVSNQPWLDGLEVALKGGQMGDVHFFQNARLGRT